MSPHRRWRVAAQDAAWPSAAGGASPAGVLGRGRQDGRERGRAIGFTLIELLIGITVLAILAALLFPVFAAAREKARTVTCGHQLRQIGLAMTLYAQDYDGVNVKYLNMVGGPPPLDVHWEVMVQPYVKNTRLFLCPDGPQREVVWDPRRNRFNSHYGMNLVGRDPTLSADFAGNLSLSSDFGVHESDIEDPASTTWVIDSTGNRVNYDPDDAVMGENVPPQPSLNVHRVAKRHSMGANAVFVDGHTKWLRTLTAPMWTRRED